VWWQEGQVEEEQHGEQNQEDGKQERSLQSSQLVLVQVNAG
jgi:hypothetical protein